MIRRMDHIPKGPTMLRSERKRSPWDWLLNATLLGAVLVIAGVFLLAVAVMLLGYLLPVPTIALHLAVRTAAVLVGLACAGVLLVAARAVRQDSLARHAAAGPTWAQDIPVALLLAEPLRRLLSPLESEGGLTGHRRR